MGPLDDLLAEPGSLCRRDSALVPYEEAMGEMREMVQARQRGERPDTVWLLSHPPVYTVGRRTPPEHRPPAGVGIPVVETDRGGKLTYHSPEQLVGYFVVQLAGHPDVARFIARVETVVAAVLGGFGIPAERRETAPAQELQTGLWTASGRKIMSLGLRQSRGVTSHGFSLDVTADLDPWRWAVPCGMPDVEMTSVARELEEAGRAVPSLDQLRDAVADALHARTPAPLS
jgi:lipoyl(octanoyl) transferase